MKNLLSIFLILFSMNAFCQNWQLFQADSTYNFNTTDIHGVRVDSVQTTAIDTTYYFNRILNDTVHQNIFNANYPITDITQPNIFGEAAIIRHDSVIFSNQFNNQIIIKPTANLNEIWNFVQTSSERIEATVDSIYTDTVNSILDSVKRISFQFFDSTNSSVNNAINLKNIFLSKNNGIVSTFNLYEGAIGNSLNNNYKIVYNRLYKSTYLTRKQIFDLEVGDEYHFNYEDKPNNAPPHSDIHNHFVTHKTVSPNGDSIKLTIDEYRETKTSTVDYSQSPPQLVYTTTNSNRTFTKYIMNPSQKFSSVVGFEPQIENLQNSAYTQSAKRLKYSYHLPYSGNTYNNRITINTDQDVVVYDTSMNSWIVDYYFTPLRTNHYLSGVFNFTNNYYNNSGGGGYPIYYSMIYFKKGTETWGQPRLVTGIENNQSTKDDFTIYPNPVNQILNIKVGQESFQEIQIFDLNGRVVSTHKFQNQINVEALKTGVYILKVIGNENVTEQKFIKH